MAPPRLARSMIGVILSLSISACDSNPVTPPPQADPVVWTRLTDPATISQPDHPDWRGDSIAFDYLDANGQNRAGTIRDDGTGAVLYPYAVLSREIAPAWVTGDLLVYASNRGHLPGSNFDIWYLDLPTGTLRQLTQLPEQEWDPSPRPGLPSLVYTEGADMLRGRITLIPDTATATPTRLYLTASSLKAGEASWDSAGNRVCFTVEDPDGSRHIWIITLSGTNIMSSVQITAGLIHDRHPRFSRDGTRILFASDRTGRSGVWWVDVTGEANGVDVIAFEDPGAEIRAPSWSPDGQQIVLSSNGRGGRAIWVLSNLGL